MNDNFPNMGSHLILDFKGVKLCNLDNKDEMDEILTAIIIGCGATIESKQFKKFEPQGLTMLYLLSESHFSIHTWPEDEACTIDFYHCGTTAEVRLRVAERMICDALGWDACMSSLLIQRGLYRQRLLSVHDQEEKVLVKDLELKKVKCHQDQELKVFQNQSNQTVVAVDNTIVPLEKISEDVKQQLALEEPNYQELKISRNFVQLSTKDTHKDGEVSGQFY